jgi:hypothetical protein
LSDWQGFREELDQKIKLQVLLKTSEQLDNETKQFVVDLQQAAWNNTLTLKIKHLALTILGMLGKWLQKKEKQEKDVRKRDVQRTKICSKHFSNNSNKKFAKLKMKVLQDS